MRFPRSAGILLHITSLSGRYGIGDLGAAAFEFVDFLAAAKQRVWQILPLCPTAEGNSPYSSYSAFAGNELLISPQSLVEAGWLDASWLKVIQATASGSADAVDYDAVAAAKQPMLEAAFVAAHERLASDAGFQTFCQQNAWWLDDFARFEALMSCFGTRDWTQWPAEVAGRAEETLADYDADLTGTIELSKFKQFLFDHQWQQLKRYANERGVQICGDMPIFVAHQSADVWANQTLFHLDDGGKPTVVAGVPPDYFSETGQLWGNPLYRWDVMEANGFAWWTARFRRALEQFDLLRVDHFRGFEAYWEVPAGAETAISGRWQPGPQDKPFLAAQAALGELPIWAEDLGEITQAVHELRDRLDFPPMRVLQFGYATEADDFHRPTTYPQHSVAYTGTHDNDTTMGWFQQRQRDRESGTLTGDTLERQLDFDQAIHFQLIGLALASEANTAIVPLQDVLGLGSQARMNVPGRATGNWRWRVQHDALTSEVATRLRQITERTNRHGG